jgi:ABC-2 type transport system permease protein
VAGLICINVMTGAFFGTGVILVGAREQQILRRYKVAPVALWKIISGLVVSRLFSLTLTTILLVVLARIVYDILLPANFFAMAVVYAVGAVMFSALSLAIASVARTVSEANGLTQVLFMPMMFLSGATFPYEFMPSWLQNLARVLPSTYYVSGLKSVMVDSAGVSANAVNLLAMGAFTLASIAVAARFFRWE